MSLLSRLFGGSSKSRAEPEHHNGYRIYPEPKPDQGGFRVAARIEKDIDGETRTHHMIRADKCQSAEEAASHSLLKAKLLIDQQGEAIFR